MTKLFGKTNGVVKLFFLTADTTAKVFASSLIHRNKPRLIFLYRNTSGRIVLITVTLDALKLTLCNIYAPNSQAEQLAFIQELNNCIVDKSELTTLIVGGDWNCSLSKKDKVGGAPWKPTNYRNYILETMDIFDLVDIQRSKHPKLRKYSYESRSLGVKSRIDFF